MISRSSPQPFMSRNVQMANFYVRWPRCARSVLESDRTHDSCGTNYADRTHPNQAPVDIEEGRRDEKYLREAPQLVLPDQ